MEKEYMFKFRTVYPLDLNTLISKVNILITVNFHDMKNKFNVLTVPPIEAKVIPVNSVKYYLYHS